MSEKDNYGKIILNRLIDKYESSKTHSNENKVSQRFLINVAKLFPSYMDESDYETFNKINLALHSISGKGYVKLKLKSGEMIEKAELNILKINEIYTFLNRKPLREIQSEILCVLEKYRGRNEILRLFCDSKIEQIRNNKSVNFMDEAGNYSHFENILIAIEHLMQLTVETFYRDFSVRVFGDSKVFDSISKNVAKIICQYSDYEDEDTVLASLNLVRNPGHIYLKGNAVFILNGQKIDLSQLCGDIALSSEMVKHLNSISVLGNRIITIENLTSFHSYSDKNDFAIYLGGYHNTVRRDFIKSLYTQNQNKQYLHFGDIDAGGFHILEHLKNKTSVEFQAYHMDIPTLKQYMEYTKPLTDNDKKRLSRFSNSIYSEVIEFMLKHNCKLEQEAVQI